MSATVRMCADLRGLGHQRSGQNDSATGSGAIAVAPLPKCPRRTTQGTPFSPARTSREQPSNGGPMTTAIAPVRDLARLTDAQLLQSHSKDHDLAVRDELVRRFMPFARKLAVRYLHSREPLDDLVQVANLGLLNAIQRFDPGQNRSFTAFAAPTILGELKRHFRDKGWSLHVPRDLKERALAASRHRERLSVEFG